MPRAKSTPKRLDIECAGSASKLPAKPAGDDDEEEADLDDVRKGGPPTAPSSSSAATAPSATASKRKRDGSSTSQQQKETVKATTSVKYFEVENETPEELGAAYLMSDAASQPTYDTMGFHRQQQLMMTARIDAARKRGDAVELERNETNKGRRGTFVARFIGNKKKFEDEGPLYSADEVAEVLATVMRRQSTKRRKATASSPCFTLEQLALRSPPFFWSLFHAFGGDVPSGLQTVLSEAEEINTD